jgi:hypothetical protein
MLTDDFLVMCQSEDGRLVRLYGTIKAGVAEILLTT